MAPSCTRSARTDIWRPKLPMAGSTNSWRGCNAWGRMKSRPSSRGGPSSRAQSRLGDRHMILVLSPYTPREDMQRRSNAFLRRFGPWAECCLGADALREFGVTSKVRVRHRDLRHRRTRSRSRPAQERKARRGQAYRRKVQPYRRGQHRHNIVEGDRSGTLLDDEVSPLACKGLAVQHNVPMLCSKVVAGVTWGHLRGCPLGPEPCLLQIIGMGTCRSFLKAPRAALNRPRW